MQAHLSVDLLVCPQSGGRLRLAETQLIEQVDRAIAEGCVVNRAGRRLEKPISGGLICDDSKVIYPIIDEIPVLLAEEAINIQEAWMDLRSMERSHDE